MVHMSYRSFLFLTGKKSFRQAQDMALYLDAANKSTCGIDVKDWMWNLKSMMWVGQDKLPMQQYGEKVTCEKCIKILKEHGL